MAEVSSTARSTSWGDHYLLLLSGVLLGYAILGKGFAYFGLPPIFIGEIVFSVGIVILLRTGCLVAVLASMPSLLLAAAMLWVLLRTLPFIDAHGVDALRDSVVIIYGGFAFIIIALLLEDPRRINTIIRYYGTFFMIYVPAIPFLFAFSHYMEESIPHVPGTTVPLIWIGPGEVAVHLAGAAVFVLAGFRKPTLVWTVLLLAAVLQGSAWSRGGMLAFVLPVTFAAILLGTIRELMVVLVIGLLIFAAAYMFEPVFNDYREANSSVERSVSTRQIVDNVASIAGRASEQTEDTKKWRLDWWDVIIKNTIYGPYFWTGRGFGLNLAEADGRTTGRSARPLRSPHDPGAGGRSGSGALGGPPRRVARHADARDVDSTPPRAGRLGQAVPVHRLLCRGDRHQRHVRRRSRGTRARRVVLVPVWVRHRLGHGPSNAAIRTGLAWLSGRTNLRQDAKGSEHDRIHRYADAQSRSICRASHRKRAEPTTRRVRADHRG
jgi:hypothetical protein